MDEQLNHAPCGYLRMSEDGKIIDINQTLLTVVNYSFNQLCGQHIHHILTIPSRLFFQMYFYPLIKVKKQVEEMYMTIISKSGEEIPVLINARPVIAEQENAIDCVIIPMRKRNEYENELLIAKKEADNALTSMNKAKLKLEQALETLRLKQVDLLELNKENQRFKVETKNELELARKIQETSLTPPISNEQIEIDTYYNASSELSGDIYGFYQIDPHRYGIILLDVMGHGISSALITMSLQALFHKLITRDFTAENVMKELDNHLHNLFYNDEDARHYCTAIYLLIDSNKQTVEYINAGHPPTLWQDPCGEQYDLPSTTPPLGTFEGIHFKTNTFSYSPGGRLLLYTDGVTDLLGEPRLSSLLANSSNKALHQLREEIITSLRLNRNQWHKNDDQCFILIDLK